MKKTTNLEQAKRRLRKKIPKIFGKSQKKWGKKMKITKIYLVLEFVSEVVGACLPYEKYFKCIREHI